MNTRTLHILISFKGNREQARKFAFGYKGGMKGCYTKGCMIFTPLQKALIGVDISSAHWYDMMHNGEIPVVL